MDGILVVDKPAGPTSHDIVSKVRRAFRLRKVGHTGTLDPLATGVLPLVLGKATKLTGYLSGGDKVYRMKVRFGESTDTFDAQGEVTSRRAVTCSEEEILTALDAFRGAIEQLPPMYSAKKLGGKKLYELARKGLEVERKPLRVTVHRLDFICFDGIEAELEASCSAGTYVRALAHDLGENLGCGAHLKELCRLAAGQFLLEDALPISTILQDIEAAKKRVIPIRRAVADLPSVALSAEMSARVRSGYQLRVGDIEGLELGVFSKGDRVVLVDEEGEPLAVTRALLMPVDLDRLPLSLPALRTERVL